MINDSGIPTLWLATVYTCKEKRKGKEIALGLWPSPAQCPNLILHDGYKTRATMQSWARNRGIRKERRKKITRQGNIDRRR